MPLAADDIHFGNPFLIAATDRYTTLFPRIIAVS
jgi:hypothetical protein